MKGKYCSDSASTDEFSAPIDYTDYKLLSVLNLSHASFKVANTAALIIFCSVVAVWEIY